MTIVVILAASQLLYAFETDIGYGIVLYETALSTITGSGFSHQSVLSRVVHVALATYSVAVFATLAGSLGAFYLGGPFPASSGIRSFGEREEPGI